MIGILSKLTDAKIVVEILHIGASAWSLVEAERIKKRDRDKDDKIRILEIRLAKLEQQLKGKRKR